MTVESLLQELELPVNADISAVETRFLEHVKQRIQAIMTSYDEEEVKGEEKWLRDVHKDFFDFSLEWAKKEMQQHKNVKNHPDAPKVKMKAREILGGLQSNMIEFSSAYTHINRFVTLIRDELKNEETRIGAVPKNVRWSSDIAGVMARQRADKKKLFAENQRMIAARDILIDLENHFKIIQKNLKNLFGQDKTDIFMRGFTAGFRTLDFKKVRRTIKDIEQSKKRFSIDQKSHAKGIEAIKNAANKISGIVEEQQKTLMGPENKLYLRPFETDLAYNSNIKDLKKIRTYLGKYYLPYMEYKLKSLAHLKERLLVIGSMESLMTLYRQLLGGIALPITEIKELRLYENEALDRTAYLLDGHFQDIHKILQQAHDTVAEFRTGREEFEEFSKTELRELGENSNASASAGSVN